jgi:hypothetical protein
MHAAHPIGIEENHMSGSSTTQERSTVAPTSDSSTRQDGSSDDNGDAAGNISLSSHTPRLLSLLRYAFPLPDRTDSNNAIHFGKGKLEMQSILER